ncbi:MAG TPA: hypothetical protein VFZ18_02335, partial [Longimicrobiaceae bacterium]
SQSGDRVGSGSAKGTAGAERENPGISWQTGKFTPGASGRGAAFCCSEGTDLGEMVQPENP